jgi:hypothetical protein
MDSKYSKNIRIIYHICLIILLSLFSFKALATASASTSAAAATSSAKEASSGYIESSRGFDKEGGTLEKKEIRTNQNKISGEFEANIQDKEALDSTIDDIRTKSIGKLELGDTSDILADVKKDDIEKEISTKSSIGAHDLEAEGRKVRAREDLEYMNDFETDYSKAGAKAHKEDAEIITSETEKSLSDVKRYLKDAGINCHSESKTPEIKDPYLIDIKREKIKEVEYDQVLCEQPRSTYNCREYLSVRCSSPKTIAGKITKISGDLVPTNLSSGTIEIGMDTRGKYHHDWGAQHDFSITFDVSNVEGINSFKLIRVSFADHVVMRLNDHIIYSSAKIVGGKLEISTDPWHYRWADGERYYGVDIGTDDYVCANTKGYHDDSPFYEVKHLLKNGHNTLKIRLVYAGGGKLYTEFRYLENKCDSWVEDRSETCTLN